MKRNAMTREEYIKLYEKWSLGECTKEELVLLEEYEDDFSLDEVYWDENKLGNKDVVIGSIYKKLEKSISKNNKTKIKWYQLSAAALVLISLSVLLYLNPFENDLSKQENKVATVAKGKAIIILEDGSQIILDNSNSEILAQQGIVSTNTGKKGQLNYEGSLNNVDEIKFNTVSIPRGGEYQLVLSDGTKVWLNSESTLKFPMQFVGNDRKVELTGEAYFEVTENKKKPFSVSVKNTEIKVLGTHFNINAYNMVNTTLIEGSVKLKSGVNEVLLKPGEFGVKNNKGKFDVGEADIEAVVAWRNGYFVFRDETIKSMMEKVSRWYDVDVEYQENVGEKEFYGKISRELNLKELLKNIELTGSVKFKIVENNKGGKSKVVVM